MPECAYPFCINNSNRQHEVASDELRDVNFHLFPKELFLREKWLKQIHQDDWKPDSSAALCSLHFSKEYIITNQSGVKILKKDAIPTEFELGCLKEGDMIEQPVSCCAYKCGNSYTPESSVTFHPLPFDQPELLGQWLAAINCNQIDEHAVLCSEHFDDSCFVFSEEGERLLIAAAIPSIFLDQEPEEEGEGGAIGEEETNAIEMENGTTEINTKHVITEEEMELINKHDDFIPTLLNAQKNLIDSNNKRLELIKKKKKLERLLSVVLYSFPLSKAEFKSMKDVIKDVDIKCQEILNHCLDPCIASGFLDGALQQL